MGDQKTLTTRAPVPRRQSRRRYWGKAIMQWRPAIMQWRPEIMQWRRRLCRRTH